MDNEIQKLIVKEFDEISYRESESERNLQGRALYNLLSFLGDNIPYDKYDNALEFTKVFRQTDVSDSAHIDMAIWCLLNSVSAKAFWRIFEKHHREKIK